MQRFGGAPIDRQWRQPDSAQRRAVGLQLLFGGGIGDRGRSGEFNTRERLDGAEESVLAQEQLARQ